MLNASTSICHAPKHQASVYQAPIHQASMYQTLMHRASMYRIVIYHDITISLLDTLCQDIFIHFFLNKIKNLMNMLSIFEMLE